MHITTLRKVGDAMMLAVPSVLLDILDLSAGSSVSIAVDNGRLVVEPARHPRYTMAEMLASSDYSQEQTAEDREWVDAPAVGREFIVAATIG